MNVSKQVGGSRSSPQELRLIACSLNATQTTQRMMIPNLQCLMWYKVGYIAIFLQQLDALFSLSF